MIIAERKPIDEIHAMLKPFDKVLIVGCGGCVTVCLTGGERSVEVLAEQLRLKDNIEGGKHTFTECTITRQCDAEYVEEIRSQAAEADVLLSMACGVGVNYMTEVLSDSITLPAMDTKCLAANIRPGEWAERCAACGSCMLQQTGGICPIARCSKSLMNGPCGGTQDGKCEVNPDTDCAWAKIVERMDKLGRLDELTELSPPRDWSTGRHGGPRGMVVAEALMDEDPEGDE